MKIKKNRKTLKKRIRRIISLCIFITVFLFSSAIIFLTAEVFKEQALLVSNYFSSSISQSINSGNHLKKMNLKDLKYFNKYTPEAKEWIRGLEDMIRVSPPANPDEKLHDEIMVKRRVDLIVGPEDLISINITLNGEKIYSSDEGESTSLTAHLNEFTHGVRTKHLIGSLAKFYNTESVHFLYDADGNTIGNVTAKVNDGFLVLIFLALVLSIIIVGLISWIIVGIIGRILTIPVIEPLNHLDEKIRAIASGDNEATMNAQIILKKPLREIESLATSTNIIMQKMKEYNNLLSAQNEELEAQNEELMNSKKEIQDTQTQLIQAENMASVGQLTAAITHEINTPLGAINSNISLCDMLLKMISENSTIQSDRELSDLFSQVKGANDISIMACQRIIEIIKSLKNFSKLDQAEFQETDITDCIKSVLVLTSNLWKRNIRIHEDYSAIHPLKCYPGLLNQVFMNLIVNAIQSMQGNGDIYIKTYVEDTNVCISIRDTGTGISKENLPRIFDSGFTTKNSGMGLGLSICRNIINKHNGSIDVDSESGKGTEFRISIPYAASTPQ